MPGTRCRERVQADCFSFADDAVASATAPESRKPAPAFELMTEDGTKMRLSDYWGKVVLLNFWATECGGCVLEIPSFIEMQKAYKVKGFTAVGVAMDVSYEGLKGPDEAWARVRPFMAKKGINYRIAMVTMRSRRLMP